MSKYRKGGASSIPCKFLAKSGVCTKKNCAYRHSDTVAALCLDYVHGKCLKDDCPLSHNPTPARMSDCVHYLAGICASNACNYRHPKALKKNAEVCRDFLKGFCKFGLGCHNLHKYHCPTWISNRTCTRGDECWHYHDPEQKRHERITVSSSSSSVPSQSTSTVSSVRTSHQRSATSFHQRNPSTLNPLKYIRPEDPYAHSSPYRKRKVVPTVEQALQNNSTPSNASEASFSIASSFYDEEKIERTGYLPLLEDEAFKKPTMPKHSSSPSPPPSPPPPPKRSSNRSSSSLPTKMSTNSSSHNNKTPPKDNKKDHSKKSESDKPPASGPTTNASSVVEDITKLLSTTKAMAMGTGQESPYFLPSLEDKSSPDEPARKKAHKMVTKIRPMQTMKHFIDFEDDRFNGFVRKDGSIEFDGISFSAECILPEEFLHLLN